MTSYTQGEEEEEDKKYYLQDLGEMVGHNGWVTSIKATVDPTIVISSSRDRTLMVWQLEQGEEAFGRPLKRLYGHEHFVEDLDVSSDGRFALSSSWDKTIRLWDLESGETKSRFVNHKNDVMAVSFSADNRQICSGSRDKTVMLWNTLGEHNYTIAEKKNPDWITCVEFSPKSNAADKEEKTDEKEAADTEPAPDFNFLVFASINGTVKKFNYDKREVECSLRGHDGAVQTISISPDGSLCASGGKDGRVFLWDLKSGQKLRTLELDEGLVQLKFNPDRYWLCGVTEKELKVWDLVKDNHVVVSQEWPEMHQKCTSVEWLNDGATLLCGFSDGVVRAKRIVEGKGYAVDSDEYDEEEE